MLGLCKSSPRAINDIHLSDFWHKPPRFLYRGDGILIKEFKKEHVIVKKKGGAKSTLERFARILKVVEKYKVINCHFSLVLSKVK